TVPFRRAVDVAGEEDAPGVLFEAEPDRLADLALDQIRLTLLLRRPEANLIHHGDDAALVGEGGRDDLDQGDRDEDDRDPDRHVVSPSHPAGPRNTPPPPNARGARTSRASF